MVCAFREVTCWRAVFDASDIVYVTDVLVTRVMLPCNTVCYPSCILTMAAGVRIHVLVYVVFDLVLKIY